MKSSLDEWWASLVVPQKERIASKIAKREVKYPACTQVWIDLDKEAQQRVYEHCTDKHGLVLTEWTEGDTYSY